MHWECIVSRALQNVLRIRNTIPSILRENILVYLSLDFTCSSKLTSSLPSIYFILWILPLNVFERERGYRWKYLILIINSKSKRWNEKNWFPIFSFLSSFILHSPFLVLHFPSPIPHSKSSILQSPVPISISIPHSLFTIHPFTIHHSPFAISHYPSPTLHSRF